MTYNSRPRQVVQIPLDKLLFFIASLYFGLTVTWIFTHQKPKQVNVAPTNTNISPSNDEFIANLEKSLAKIDQKTVTAKVAKPSPQPTSVPPVVRIAPPPPPPPISTPATPVERIYIPVYPQNPSFTAAKPKKLTPSTPAKPAKPQLPLPQKVTVSSIPIPPPPPVVTVAPSAIPTPPIQPIFAGGGKLVGILELGERSSALFDVDGITKRVAIGENVNGWVILQIKNQQVFLSRGSTTKVIDVGQSL
ncbi:hypothetical protein C7H19_11325 [Aphanothece hegewaldii CCALA 016]|uniref:Type II secretion system protein GspC N-terminal domain-containing protein n=1 Tax=Aphanothece hegewaldii CCALA 016 TaxID=2107694 RepID=A0A2T1LY66_9CHRO|nr:hypothetical protein [Aphanothece hegewaldii]PSF37301.1 hypothetical protein C7H19_11325 [Aphanothece hegewaldii CCALA 016]